MRKFLYVWCVWGSWEVEDEYKFKRKCFESSEIKKGVYINIDNYERLNMKVALDNVDEWCFDGEVMSIGRKYIIVKFKDMCKKFDANNYCRSLFKAG